MSCEAVFEQRCQTPARFAGGSPGGRPFAGGVDRGGEQYRSERAAARIHCRSLQDVHPSRARDRARAAGLLPRYHRYPYHDMGAARSAAPSRDGGFRHAVDARDLHLALLDGERQAADHRVLPHRLGYQLVLRVHRPQLRLVLRPLQVHRYARAAASGASRWSSS